MLDSLLIHPVTRRLLDASLGHPPHALLLAGPAGMGKLTLARVWARRVADNTQPQIVAPDEKGTISIDTIRDLYQTTRSKRKEHQVVVLDHAEAMSLEAQNAFLKLLEEPRPGLTFVLTTPYPQALLATIRSRTQQILVHPIEDERLRALPAVQTVPDTGQLLFIAHGRPGALATLAADHALLNKHKAYMQQAKELLSANLYSRLSSVTSLAADRTQCITVLEAMLRIAGLQLTKSPETKLKHWLRVTDAVESALLQLSRNANLKTQLLKLFTSY